MAENKRKYENSRLIMASYGSHQFFSQWITGSFGIFVFYFYEVEIGLNVTIAALAFIIYSVWNAVNDPLIGYMLERVHMPWQRKWGVKRFPWIVLGAIPWMFTYLLIFLVPFNWDPVGDRWSIFLWYLLTLCLYDTLFTLWNVNAVALYPDKFRDLNERRTATGIGTLIGMIGIVCAMTIPPLLVSQGVPQTYRNMAWFSIAIGFLLFFFMIPGVFENKKMRERYKLARDTFKTEQREPFFKTTKRVLTNRRFIVKMIFFWGYQAAAALLQVSAAYVVTFILDEVNFILTIILAFMLLGAVISLPIWTFISKRMNNNKKFSLVAGFMMYAAFIPLYFGLNIGLIGYA
ncbi:MAG: MFS transporter, partial [Promethearchaeota archaeon]